MKIKHAGSLILLAVIWGSYYIASQKAVQGLSIFSIGIMIRLITMVLLSCVMLKKGELRLLKEIKGIWPRLLLIGCLGFSLDLTAFIGLSLSPAGTGTALLKCDIIFVNIISVVIYKEKFTKLDWAYTFVMLSGVLLVMGIDLSKFNVGNKGNIFFILSALFVSINAFVIKSVQSNKKNPAENNVIAFYNNFVTMILFIISAGFMGAIGQIAELGRNTSLLIAVTLAGVGQTLVYIVYYYNLRKFPVWIVKVFLLLVPIVSAFVSFILFGDKMQINQYVGILIVLVGAFGILTEQGKKAGQRL